VDREDLGGLVLCPGAAVYNSEDATPAQSLMAIECIGRSVPKEVGDHLFDTMNMTLCPVDTVAFDEHDVARIVRDEEYWREFLSNIGSFRIRGLQGIIYPMCCVLRAACCVLRAACCGHSPPCTSGKTDI
jgi:hypothetical protein